MRATQRQGISDFTDVAANQTDHRLGKTFDPPAKLGERCRCVRRKVSRPKTKTSLTERHGVEFWVTRPLIEGAPQRDQPFGCDQFAAFVVKR
jgi:hypothetical protein